MYVSLCTYEAEHQFPHRQKIEREMVFRQSVRGVKWILCGNAKIHKFTPFVALYWMQALPHAIFISSNLQCPALCVCASVWFFFHMKIEWSASPKKPPKWSELLYLAYCTGMEEVENSHSHTRASISWFYVYSLFLASTLNIKQFRLPFQSCWFILPTIYTHEKHSSFYYDSERRTREEKTFAKTLSPFVKSLALMPRYIRNGK